MNREIKFRGEREDNGKWVYGFVNKEMGGVYILHPLGVVIEVLPETVGEYIGLQDKNIKEICEGDILKNPHRTGIVEWEKSMARFVVKPIGESCSYLNYDFELPSGETILEDTEIIGNKFDNPELKEN